MIIDDTMLVSGSAAASFNGSITARGDIIITNTSGLGGGSGTITISGTGNQLLSGGAVGFSNRLPSVTINKSTGTLSFSNTIAVVGNWTYTTGTLNSASGQIHFVGTKTISGTHTLNDVRLGVNATYTISNTLTLNGTLTYGNSNSGSVRVNTGTINVHGNVELKTPVAGGGGTGTIVINGTGDQTITGNAIEGYSALPNLTINKSTGTLTLDSTITVAGNWTYTAGHVVSTTATVCFWNTKTITGSDTLTRVSFNGSTTAAFTISSGTTLTVSGLLAMNGSVQVAINTGTIQAQGNIEMNNTYNSVTSGGSALILINGTGSQTLTGNTVRGNSRLPNVRINKSSGALSLVNYVTIQGNFTYTSGTVNAGSSTVHFVGTKTIAGSLALNNISFGAPTNYTYTISTGTVITTKGSLETIGSGNITIDTGTIRVRGDIILTNTGAGGGGSATITLDSSANQTFTGSGTAGQGRLPNVTIDKSGGTLTLSSIISVAGNWVYTQGTVAPGSSTVAFYGTKNLDGQQSGSTTCMPFYNIAVNGDTRTLTGHIDCSNNFTIASGATCSAGSNKIYVGGDWNSAGTWTYGTSTVVFDGNGYNKIQGAAGTITFANVELSRNTVPGTPAKNIRLLNPVLINTAMTLNKGRVYSTATNYLSFADNATCTVTNDDSAYVHGPVRKMGDDVFSFPLGDTTLHDSVAYHPLAISAPASTGDQFDACYLAVAQTAGAGMVDSLTGLSTSEHWTLNRTAGSSAVTVTVSWNKNSKPSSLSDLRVAAWNSGTSQWADLGQASLAINWPTGTVTASATTIFNSNAAVIAPAYTLPKYWGYATLRRKLDGGYYETKNNAIYFRFDDEYNDQNHHLTYSIYNTANTDVAPTLVATSNNAAISSYGDNRFKIDLWTSTSILASGYYILEVRNEKNEVFYLRFRKS